ncbi:DUF4143 domain-containing protein [uncultured Sphaerochaeta sp.]|uniref:ATP-binding protein n=1 Tax=uncultured Sphaerochaeta sp. TaxID=886478 RepID=UPI002AA95DD3|nr:DUF4143 domain-containing protein [uncultured Sphaerochaeta sp.]
MKSYITRILDVLLEEYLQTFGAVNIQGPKWCGKTTTAEQKAKSIIRFQDPDQGESNRMMAEIDASYLLKGAYPRLLDEWQVVPPIWDAVRLAVDNEQEEGMFILTGSSVPVDDGIHHSGTGRISRLVMRPMSLFESGESNGSVSLSSLFSSTTPIDPQKSEITIPDLAFLMCRGGWPASVNKSEKSALLIAQEYIVSLAESEVSRTSGSKKNPQRVMNLLRSYARNISTLATNKSIIGDIQANDLSFSETTYYEYLNALQRLYIVEDVPAWNPAIRSKTALRSRSKHELADPSLVVAGLGLSSDVLLKDLPFMGFVFETLCIRDLRVYSQKMGGSISYYHDRYDLECDCVLHLRDGRYALIECKMGGSGIDEGAEHLLELVRLIKLHKMQAPSFLMVLTASEIAYERPDGVKVVPIGCLGV